MHISVSVQLVLGGENCKALLHADTVEFGMRMNE